MWTRTYLASFVWLACSCGGPPEPEPLDASTDGAQPQDAGAADMAGLDLLAIDQQVYDATPAMMLVTASGVPRDETGWLGRNRSWGALYSVRFQVGAGIALRVRLAARDAAGAAGSFHAIEVGVAEILADGEIPSTLPDSVTGGLPLPARDIASAAAFFLSDACPALLALEAWSDADTVASLERRQALLPALARGLDWLETQESLLVDADSAAPNRLFHDAVAYRACAVLVGDESAGALAESFGQRAMDDYAGDELGYFIEGDGYDTNYQAVNLYMATDFIVLRDSDVAQAARAAVAAGASWATGRVDISGAVDSTGNRRSCGGCENFLAGDRPKELGLGTWLRGLTYSGALSEQPDAFAAADRFVSWAQGSPAPTTSCYERPDGMTLEPVDLNTRCR